MARRLNTPFLLVILGVSAAGVVIIGGLLYLKTRNDPMRYVRKGDAYMETQSYRDATAAYMRAIGKDTYEPRFYDLSIDALTRVVPNTQQDANDRFNTHMALLVEKGRILPGDQAFDPIKKSLILNRSLLEGIELVPGAGARGAFERIANDFDGLELLPNSEAEQAWILNHLLEEKWRFSTVLSEVEWEDALADLEDMVAMDPSNSYNQYAVLRGMIERVFEELDNNRRSSAQRELAKYRTRFEEARGQVPDAAELDLLEFELAFHQFTHGQDPQRPDAAILDDIFEKLQDVDDRRILSEFMSRAVRLAQVRHIGSMDTFGVSERKALIDFRNKIATQIFERDPEDIRNIFLYLTTPDISEEETMELANGILDSEMPTVGVNARLREQSFLRAARILFERAYSSHTIARSEYNQARLRDDSSPDDIEALREALAIRLEQLEKSYAVVDEVLAGAAVENEAVRLMAQMDLAYAKEEWDKALQAVNQYLALGNNFDSSRLLTAADVSMRAGDFGAASRFADQLLDIRPDLVNNGEFSLIRARLAAASSDFTRAISLANQVIGMEDFEDQQSQLFAEEARMLLKNLNSMRAGVQVTDDPLYKVMADVQRARAEEDIDQQRAILIKALAEMENPNSGSDLDSETRSMNAVRLLSALAMMETTEFEGDPQKAKEYAERLMAIDPSNQTGKLISQVAGKDSLGRLSTIANLSYPDDEQKQKEQYWMLLRNQEKQINSNLDRYLSDPGAYTAVAVEKMKSDLASFSTEADQLEAELLAADDMSTRARRFMTRQALEQNDLELAADMLDAIRSLDGETWRTSLMDAQIRAANGDTNAAIEILELAIEEGRSNATLQRAYGRQLLRSGRLVEGLEALSISHRDAPNNPAIAIDLAQALVRMGDSGTALQVMRRSSASGRSSSEFMDLWLALESAVGEPMVGMVERSRIWELNPSNWENGAAYAALLIDAPIRWNEIRDPRTSKPTFREAEWERLPTAEKQKYIDEVREKRKQISDDIFKELTSRPNASPAVFAKYADALESRGDRSMAIQVLIDAVDNSNSVLAEGEKALLAVDIGRRYLDLVQRDDAEEWFAKAREIQPANNRVADKALVILWRNRNNAVRMVEVLEDLLANSTDEDGSIDRKATARLLVRALLDSNLNKKANQVFNEEFAESDYVEDRMLAGTVNIANARQARIDNDMATAKEKLLIADEQFKIIALEDPGIIEPTLQRAIIHDLLYQWTDKQEELLLAIELAREATGQMKSSWVAQELLARLLLQADDYDSAIGSLESYLEGMPDADNARQFLLNIYQARGMNDRAVEIAQQAVEKNPYDIGWNVRLGRIRAEQGRYSDAADAFGRLYEMTKDIGLARVFIEMKLLRDPPDVNGVMGFARSNRTMFKTDPFLRGAYAATLAHGGKPDQAIQEFENDYALLRDAGADDVSMQQFMGWLPRIMAKIHDDKDVALRTEELIDSISNGDPDMSSRLILAQLWFAEGDSGASKAIEHLRVLTESSKDDSESTAPLTALAAILFRIGECEDSIEIMRKALDTNPNDSALLNNCAFIYAKCDGDLDLARSMIMKAIDLDPFNAQFLDTLGYVEMLRGEFEAANRWLRKSVKRRKSASNLMHLAELLIRQGDFSGAETLLIEAGDLNPSASQQEDINKLVKQIAAGAKGESR